MNKKTRQFIWGLLLVTTCSISLQIDTNNIKIIFDILGLIIGGKYIIQSI